MNRENLIFKVVFWNLTEEFDNFASWFLRAWQNITHARPPTCGASRSNYFCSLHVLHAPWINLSVSLPFYSRQQVEISILAVFMSSGKPFISYIFIWEIDHFTVVCLVTWPLNESEAGVDLVFMLMMPCSCKLVKIYLVTYKMSISQLSAKNWPTYCRIPIRLKATFMSLPSRLVLCA